jgi:hypothetical protein
VEGSGHGPVLGSVQLLLDNIRKNQFSSFAILAVGDSSVRHYYAFLWRLLTTHSIHMFPCHFPFAQTFANALCSDYTTQGLIKFWGPSVCEKEYKIWYDSKHLFRGAPRALKGGRASKGL